ncbi:MAG: hypothetical protein LBN39_06705 [Planctomycetaceae bacterium]|jgi:hypothetical protein|nr:hypothetical protein [Planctomycetaceae bacterium]
MKNTVFFFVLFSVTVLSGQVFAEVPASWTEEWKNPSAKNRPLQIIHGWYGDRTTPEKLRYYKEECGLGGLVVNVPPNNYLRNEDEWKRFVDVVRSAKETGLRIWIYDEDGYPSLMAGGIVLEGHPELESQALTYDKTKTGEAAFAVRPAYEHTHASSKYAVLRRYPNPLNPEATLRFIDVTHNAYKKYLGDLHNYVEAYFTDEPSLNAVNIGTIPEEVQKTLQIADPIDANVPLLPMLAWSDELAKMDFSKQSLFTGDTDADKNERQRFWETVAQLNAKYYYGVIQDWCKANGVVSSGHTLHEENVLGHVPLDGNKLTALRKMDIPGLDELNSWTQVNIHGGWKAAGFPASAAALNGTRKIFTEISDFAQKMSGDKKPATLDGMEAAAAWEAIWGVTEFTLYYNIDDRSPALHKEYCDYVGRLNAILRDATPVHSVLLYYPITDVQREYKPTAEPLNLQFQSKRLQEIIQSFDRLGSTLVRYQIPFIIVDGQGLKDWIQKNPNGTKTVFVPQNVSLPDEVKQPGITEVRDGNFTAGLEPLREKFEPASEFLSFGKFHRNGKTIYVVYNADDKPYQGTLKMNGVKVDTQLDPKSREIRPVPAADAVPLLLEPYRTMIFVGQ